MANYKDRAANASLLERNKGWIIPLCAAGIMVIIAIFYFFGSSPAPSSVEEQGLSKSDAVEACKEGILARSAHPSTVEFPTFDYDFTKYDDDSSSLWTGFKAKNSFNLEIGFDAKCTFEGYQLKEVIISEARS